MAETEDCREESEASLPAQSKAIDPSSVDAAVGVVESSKTAAAGDEVRDTDVSHRWQMCAGNLTRLHAQTEGQIAQVQASLEALARQVSFLPPQLQMFGAKIDGLAISISETRCQAMLAAIVTILGLVEDMLRAAADQDVAAKDHYANYELLRIQLRQLLEANGVAEIIVDGPFDPRVHRAVQRVACENPADHNRILAVVRPGFRTPQAVLRSADVCVGYCTSVAGGSRGTTADGRITEAGGLGTAPDPRAPEVQPQRHKASGGPPQ